jgi:hypothetical protein
VSVSANAPTHFSLFPSSFTPKAGQPFFLTVTALDAYGNRATAYRGTIHFTSTDLAAVLPADYAFTSTDAGKHTFTVTLNTVGTQSITATDKAHATLKGTVHLNVQAATRAPISDDPDPTLWLLDAFDAFFAAQAAPGFGVRSGGLWTAPWGWPVGR